jgi:hypothetical protein
LRARVGKKRKADLPPRGKIQKNRFRIVAHGRYSKALLLDCGPALFQLDQLGLAEGSPVRRTIEDQNETFRPGECL